METFLIAFITSLVTGIGAGVVSYVIQERRLSHEIKLEKLKITGSFKSQIEQIKTEYMAEQTAKKYLEHPDHTKRSFSLLKARLGGFEDNELRKILVRAGAVKFVTTKEGKRIEWWGLLDKNPELSSESEED